jgi:hypothetical protein
VAEIFRRGEVIDQQKSKGESVVMVKDSPVSVIVEKPKGDTIVFRYRQAV